MSKLTLSLDDYAFSSFVGGSSEDQGKAVYTGDYGVYIAGWTNSPDIPVSGFDNTINGCKDAIIYFFSADYMEDPTPEDHFPVISFFTYTQSETDSLTVTFTVGASDPDNDPLIYRWDFDGDGRIDKEGNSDNETYTYSSPGTYTVKVYVYDGKIGRISSSLTFTVSQGGSGNNGGSNHSPEITSFKAEPSSGYAPLTVTFTVDATDPDGDSLTYRYDFDGDGSWDKTGGSQETHQYSNPGTYTVKVEVDDGNGGKVNATVEVRVMASGGDNNNSDEENEESNGTEKGVSVSGTSDKSSGCACQVGKGSNNLGDLLFYLLIILAFVYNHKFSSSLKGRRR